MDFSSSFPLRSLFPPSSSLFSKLRPYLYKLFRTLTHTPPPAPPKRPIYYKFHMEANFPGKSLFFDQDGLKRLSVAVKLNNFF